MNGSQDRGEMAAHVGMQPRREISTATWYGIDWSTVIQTWAKRFSTSCASLDDISGPLSTQKLKSTKSRVLSRLNVSGLRLHDNHAARIFQLIHSAVRSQKRSRLRYRRTWRRIGIFQIVLFPWAEFQCVNCHEHVSNINTFSQLRTPVRLPSEYHWPCHQLLQALLLWGSCHCELDRFTTCYKYI